MVSGICWQQTICLDCKICFKVYKLHDRLQYHKTYYRIPLSFHFIHRTHYSNREWIDFRIAYPFSIYQIMLCIKVLINSIMFVCQISSIWWILWLEGIIYSSSAENILISDRDWKCIYGDQWNPSFPQVCYVKSTSTLSLCAWL